MIKSLIFCLLFIRFFFCYYVNFHRFHTNTKKRRNELIVVLCICASEHAWHFRFGLYCWVCFLCSILWIYFLVGVLLFSFNFVFEFLTRPIYILLFTSMFNVATIKLWINFRLCFFWFSLVLIFVRCCIRYLIA